MRTLLALLLSAPAAWAAPPAPVVAEARPAPEWEATFAGKEGWIGGDGVYSAALSSRRTLWLFGDTLLGKVKDGGRSGAAMVNNTVAVQEGRRAGDTIRFVAGRTKDDKPAALFTPAEGEGWFWPLAAVRIKSRLFVFLARIVKADGGGAFGFRHVSQWLAVVENPDDEPRAWRCKQHRLPFAVFDGDEQRSWGSAVLRQGDFLHVYGYHERGKGIGNRRLIVARVPAEKLDDFAAWRFHSAKGWSEQPGESAALADGLATEFSVSRGPGGKGCLLVYTENGLGDRIVGRFADAPEGPWSAPVLLYRCPEMARDKGVFCYSAKAHAWAAKDGGLLVSYCVNAWEFARLFRDEAVYRPKFVRVKLRPTP